MLNKKRILLGITGGIAAYKSAELIRQLTTAGVDIRVVMTSAAEAFVTPLTYQALSGHPVHRNLLDADSESAMDHIALARWADAILIAPTSADFMAKLAHGNADDLLSTVCLASNAPLAVAPAMNQQMWANPATQNNVALLKQRGTIFFGPADGEQACGDIGPGRMLEPEQLCTLLDDVFESGELESLRLTITAGPTWEALDPVRGLTNHSSGKMGYALAAAAAEAGANTTLISGPTNLPCPDRVERIDVISATEMHHHSLEFAKCSDIFIAVAAVSDYRPATAANNKIKKDAHTLSLELIRNPDILTDVSTQHPNLFTVGFAAETKDVISHAKQKLLKKRLDIIIANRVGPDDQGFNSENNQATLIDRQSNIEFQSMPKPKLARRLIKEIARRYETNRTTKNTRQAS